MRRAVAVAGVLLLGWALVGQAETVATGAVAGRVLDAATGRGLAGATVEGAGRSTASGADGAFRLDGVPAGRHTLTVSRAGYRPERRPDVQVAAGATTTVEFRLRAEPPAAQEAEVEAKVSRTPRKTKARPFEARAERGAVGRGRGAAVWRPGPPAVVVGASAPPPVQAVDVLSPGHEREGYDPIRENPFVAVREQPLSTFSIDVDTASYANVRRFVGEGRLPPKDAVRIEELVNYFPYRYPEPTDAHPFAVHTEISVAPWNPAHRLLRIGLQGRRVDTASLPPSNLVFLVDVSGSMNNADKLPLLKNAFKLLVNHLRKQDRVAIVVYAGAAGLVLPSTPGSDKGAILDALDRLQAGGSTAGGAGIRLAYEVARRHFLEGGNNRVVLATDGDFNVGASSDAEMVRLIEKEREGGVFLTVLGFGRGNYQDAKMQKLANSGNGNHAYIDSLLEARKVLVTEMGGTLLTIAKDVKLQLEFNPTQVEGYRLIGYENRLLRARDFNDDAKDAGELGAGHSVTALYELVPAGAALPGPGVDPLKYQRTATSAAARSDELLTLKLRYKAPDGDTSALVTHAVRDAHRPLAETSADFRFATAVVEFGLLLRDSEHKGAASFDALLERAREATTPETDPEGYRHDFVKLAEQARRLRSAQSGR